MPPCDAMSADSYRWAPIQSRDSDGNLKHDHARYSRTMSPEHGWNDNIDLKQRYLFFKHKLDVINAYDLCTISIVRRKDPCVYKIISDMLKVNKEMDTCSEVESAKEKKNYEKGWHVSLKGWVSGIVGFYISLRIRNENLRAGRGENIVSNKTSLG